jgi:LytS/YehU family sensor histidine kinase
MEPGVENLPTIKLIVQPIVENAIYHGIKYLQESSRRGLLSPNLSHHRTNDDEIIIPIASF